MNWLWDIRSDMRQQPLSPHLLVMHWKPTPLWFLLSKAEQWGYLQSLDKRIAAGQTQGMQVLGWSRVAEQLPLARDSSYVGVFGFQSTQELELMLLDVSGSSWYDYFETENIVMNLEGADSQNPHLVYAHLLGLSDVCVEDALNK